jgi:guanylate kinase
MAPMGSGKGTIVQHALATHPDIYHTISCTSRVMRPGEVEGEHYYYISKAEFEQKVAVGDFLEWAEFAGNKYGTLKSEILPHLYNGEIVITEIDLQGVEQLMELLPRDRLTVVYIEAGGWEVLSERAQARAPMTETELEKRYERFLVEQAAKPIADVVIDNTGDIELAHDAFEQVIATAHKKCDS